MFDYEWDPEKARINQIKHGISFADASAVLEDVHALTLEDDQPGEQRFITIGKDAMEEYEFSKGKRGAVNPVPTGKTRITIRLDDEVIDWFRQKVELQGGGSYQTMINQALRDYVFMQGEHLEQVIRRVVREELQNYR